MRLALVWCIFLFATFFFKKNSFHNSTPPWPSALKNFLVYIPFPKKKQPVCGSAVGPVWMASRKLDPWFWWFYGKFFTVLGKGGLLHLAVVWHLKTHHLKKITKVASNLRRPHIKRFQDIYLQSLVNMLIDGTIFESHFSLSDHLQLPAPHSWDERVRISCHFSPPRYTHWIQLIGLPKQSWVLPTKCLPKECSRKHLRIQQDLYNTNQTRQVFFGQKYNTIIAGCFTFFRFLSQCCDDLHMSPQSSHARISPSAMWKNSASSSFLSCCALASLVFRVAKPTSSQQLNCQEIQLNALSKRKNELCAAFASSFVVTKVVSAGSCAKLQLMI